MISILSEITPNFRPLKNSLGYHKHVYSKKVFAGKAFDPEAKRYSDQWRRGQDILKKIDIKSMKTIRGHNER